MRTDAMAQPAPWVIDRFGDKLAAELWHRVPMALAAAVRRALDAHVASQMNTNHAFGSARWPLQYEELVTHLQALPNAMPIRPTRAFYQLIIVGGHVLLPWHYGKQAGVDMREVRPGKSLGLLARSILAHFGPEPRYQQMPLPSMPKDDDEPDVAQISEILANMNPPPKTIVVGYACNAHQGLLRVCLGDAALGMDGEFQWYHCDALPMPAVHVPEPRRGEV
ncbi:hypothetical protein [Phytohabitans kaempferiae]|uniref:Uncharacterized protein n=1 Tax=Phytohabitans kaempferiae TaxID=1620943 RepID=A0ABV6MDJ7_9ACTN